MKNRTCDLCDPLLLPDDKKIPPIIYDCKTQMGPWACLCEYHFRHCGFGLGTGRGQMYDNKTGAKLDG
jgi:hypothetical protein